MKNIRDIVDIRYMYKKILILMRMINMLVAIEGNIQKSVQGIDINYDKKYSRRLKEIK